MEAVAPERRPRVAIVGFGYWLFGLLLGVIALAAGLKKAVGDPYDPLEAWIAGELAVGVALFLVCDVGFRRTLGIPNGGIRVLAGVGAVATIVVGTEVAAAAQVGALGVIVVLALVADAWVARARARARQASPLREPV
jgi:low temperature requirement protein LtrA